MSARFSGDCPRVAKRCALQSIAEMFRGVVSHAAIQYSVCQEQERRKSRELQNSIRAIFANRPSDSNELPQNIQCNEMRRAKSTRKYFDFRSEKGPGPLQSQHRTATAPKSFFGFAFPRVSKERQRQSFQRHSSGFYFLRWRILARIRRFLRPILRRPLPDFFVPKSKLPRMTFVEGL